MTEKRRKYIVYGILVVAVIWGIWNNPFTAEKKNKPGMSEQAPPPSGPADMVATIAPADIGSVGLTDTQDWKDDPFVRRKAPQRQGAQVSEAPVQFKLSAISSSGGGTMAIIDGQIVKQGGAIDGWTVASIDGNSVLLKKGSENVKLNLRRR
ncbi:MAG: hypothetical protein KKG33_06650 [candidate division Zixibacteria bacterium]|nr:hypothetical protein [candidate division Zixibacteria bacterium]MBU1469729.1 hypothetical protein [candidate division Zixibacteria bacterium]MBU2625221.1 hypothetical protein [candidate division Zixibacteria bacterium]